MTTTRAADRKCPKCNAMAQVTEDRTVRHTAEWVSREIVQVDRTIHCVGHVLEREINGKAVVL